MQPSITYRIVSIDILRGLVMIIMALDHTRDYFHHTALTADPLDPAITTIPLYFTRWITHFCAPVFVFLSGVSAYLSGIKKSQKEASAFLIKRGLWLILMEVTIVTFGLTFNPTFNFMLLQVIWAIGFSMVVLGFLTRISSIAVPIAGTILFFGHNILNYVSLPQTGIEANLWRIFFTAPIIIPIDKNHFLGVFYAALPWTGVMLLGYSIGHLFQKNYDLQKRKRFLLSAGICLCALFLLLRTVNEYGNPIPWQRQGDLVKNMLAFLNTSKYPPSLQFLSMILGPSLILLSQLKNNNSKPAAVATVYGRVPFFYFLAHFYLLHIILVIVFFATGHTTNEIRDPGSIFLFRPANWGFGLPIVYLIWICVVIALYYPCKWFYNFKRLNDYWWLKYV